MRRAFIEEAKNQAFNSEMQSLHGAVLVHRGKIVGKGFNKYVFHSSNNKDTFSVHAEVCAIENALLKVPLEEVKKCDLVIIRVNRNGDFLNSCPCKKCQQYIKNIGIKTTYYS
jgi:tRNA(Arg) A34 adenosine deaminase TadA